MPAPIADAKSKLQRAIEDEERKEMVERQLAREVQEFVEETTRLAASILNQVSTQEEQHHHQQIAAEMKEFFQATLHRAESMLESLRTMEDQGASVAELEATLQNVTTKTLDEFRAEGAEALREAHIGEDPRLTSLEPDEEEPSVQPGALSLISKEAGWKEIESPGAESAPHEESHEEDYDAEGTYDMEPLGEDFEFIEEVDGEAQVSGAWRAADPDSEDKTSPIEEVTVETEFAADFVDDSEEEALAADPFAEVQEPSVEPEPKKDGFPPFFEKWRHDKAGLKKALTVMVKNGLMTPEEARKIFSQA